MMAPRKPQLSGNTEHEVNERRGDRDGYDHSDMTLGARMKMARMAAGLFVTDIAAQLGVSKQAVGYWESDRSEPTLTNLRNIAKMYQVGLDWLLNGHGRMQQGSFQKHTTIQQTSGNQDRQTELLETIHTMQSAGLQIGRVILSHDTIMVESKENNGPHRKTIG